MFFCESAIQLKLEIFFLSLHNLTQQDAGSAAVETDGGGSTFSLRKE